MGRKLVWPPKIHVKRGSEYFKYGGHTITLGPAGSDEARDRFREIADQIKRTGGVEPRPQVAAGVTVAELIDRYTTAILAKRKQKNGKPTTEAKSILAAMRPLLFLIPRKLIERVTPADLEAVQEIMVTGYEQPGGKIRRPQCLVTVNGNLARLKAPFLWAVRQQLLPAENYYQLKLVKRLLPGDFGVIQTDDVPPVPEADLAKTLPHIGPVVREMVDVQLLCGCRAGEIVTICPGQIDREGPDGNWIWTLPQHKNTWRGKGHEKTYLLGPEAQAILLPLLLRADDAPCFSPREACARAGLVGKRTDGRAPGVGYSIFSYENAIERACRRAQVAHWSPGQLRHSTATRLVERFGNVEGLELAQQVLGHKDIKTTQIYANLRNSTAKAKASKIMAKIG